MKNRFVWIAATLLVLFLQSTAFSQRFGIKAGLNLANINSDYDDGENQTLATFNVGGVGEFDLSESMGIGVGLQIAGKGAKVEDSGFKAKFNPIYLQIPVHVYYRNSGFYAGVGPYLGFGLFGNYSVEYNGDKESESISFGNEEEDDLGPMDFGLGFEAGYHVMAPLRISLSYDLGLMNVEPDAYEDDYSSKNNVFGINLTWYFSGVE